MEEFNSFDPLSEPVGIGFNNGLDLGLFEEAFTSLSPEEIEDERKAFKGISVKFYQRAELNRSKSLLAGRRVFDSRDYIRFELSQYEVTDRRVIERDKQIFASQWQQYLNGRDQIGEGTPLSLWPQIDAATVEELKHLKIFTVDQLAAISDSQASLYGKLVGRLREQAKAFISNSAKSQEVSDLQIQNIELKEKLEKLQAEVSKIIEQKASGTVEAVHQVADSVKEEDHNVAIVHNSKRSKGA